MIFLVVGGVGHFKLPPEPFPFLRVGSSFSLLLTALCSRGSRHLRSRFPHQVGDEPARGHVPPRRFHLRHSPDHCRDVNLQLYDLIVAHWSSPLPGCPCTPNDLWYLTPQTLSQAPRVCRRSVG